MKPRGLHFIYHHSSMSNSKFHSILKVYKTSVELSKLQKSPSKFEKMYRWALFHLIWWGYFLGNAQSKIYFDLTPSRDNQFNKPDFDVPPPNEPPVTPPFVSSANRDLHAQFLAGVMSSVLEHGVFFNEDGQEQEPALQFKGPEELRSLLNLTVGEEPTDHSILQEIIRDVLRYSPKPSHRFMLDKRVSGLDPYALFGDWVGATMSNLLVSYQCGPVWTLMELEVVKQLSKLIGWELPTEGVSTSGAGAGNSLAVGIALQNKYPTFKEGGFASSGWPHPVIFLSQDASNAFKKAALYEGLGSASLEYINTDPATGRMDVRHLLERIQYYKNGNGIGEPIMVVATLGTTLLGAVDPVEEIAKICEQEKLWLHVDAERGGPLVFLKNKNRDLAALARADSVLFGTWMLAAPYVTTFLLTKYSNKLQKSFGLHSEIVYTALDLYNTTFDIGDHTVQTSRRPEVSKLWFSWKARGLRGLENLIDIQYKNMQTFSELIKQEPALQLVFDTFDLPQVAVYYIPESLRSRDTNNINDKEQISRAASFIRNRMIQENILQLSLGVQKRRPSFLIIPLTNTILSPEDFAFIIDTIKYFGAEFDSNGSSRPPAPRPSIPNVNLATRKRVGSTPTRLYHGLLYEQLFQMFLKKGIFFLRTEPPSKFKKPEVLLQLIDLQLDKDFGTLNSDLMKTTEKIIEYSPHWGHPYFIYQLAAGLDPYTLAADYVISAMNTPMLTFEDSPVFTLAEEAVLSAFRQRIFDSSEGDGTFTDGGSMANQMAIALARHRKVKSIKEQGYSAYGKKLVLYASEDAHFCTQKGTILEGLGGNNTVLIAADKSGHMDVKELELSILDSIDDGDIPFMIVITAGTTIYGAIDHVEDIVGLCEKYDLWCHVDGMFGGLTAMSDKYKPRLKGIERVDSYGVDLHKLMGSTMVMTALISRHPGVLQDTFETRDTIDFYRTNDDLYDKNNYDLGDAHWQVDKRNNIFKFWLLWKAKGRKGFEDHVDHIISNAQYLVSQLHRREGFEPMLENFENTNVCFLYIPPSLRNVAERTTYFYDQISDVSYELERQMTLQGLMNIVTQKRHSIRGSTPVFLKFVMMGSTLTPRDIDYLLDVIDYNGRDIEPMPIKTEMAFEDEEKVEEEFHFDPFGNQPAQPKQHHNREIF